jgi:signal transduction histidine kinase
MVGAIASRNAAVRLAIIIAALLIPIFVLGFFLVTSLNKDIRIAGNEIAGVRFNNLVRNVLIGAATDSLSPDDIGRYLKEGPSLAASTGSVPQFDQLADALQAPNKDIQLILRLSEEAITANGDSSGLILDPDSSTFHFAVTLVTNLPEFVHSILDIHASGESVLLMENQALENLSAGNGATAGLSDQRHIRFFSSFGQWRESLRRVETALLTAERSANVIPFKIHETTWPEIVDHAYKIQTVATDGDIDQLARRISSSPEFAKKRHHILKSVAALWSATSDALERGLIHRRDFLKNRLLWVLLTSLGTCLIGLGASIYMFKTTLKRLDDVQETNAQLHASRNELQLMSDKLVEVNNGVSNLNVELANKMKALTEAQDEIVKRGKMSQMGQLTATVAHELRNPLGSVRTSAFVLERKLKDADPLIKTALARIAAGIVRCDSIITQLLDFSRGGSLNAVPSVLDNWLVDLVEEEAAKLPGQVEVQLFLGLEGAEVAFDAPRLSRALINLISNASEALISKRSDDEASQQRPTIVISTKATERGFEISVADNGPGIAPENRGKVFNPLFTTKSFGTGLGLPAVENIMREHGGGTELDTEVGKGTTFTLWLPAKVEVSHLRTA